MDQRVKSTFFIFPRIPALCWLLKAGCIKSGARQAVPSREAPPPQPRCGVSSRLYASCEGRHPPLLSSWRARRRGPSQGGRGHLPASEGDKGKQQQGAVGGPAGELWFSGLRVKTSSRWKLKPRQACGDLPRIGVPPPLFTLPRGQTFRQNQRRSVMLTFLPAGGYRASSASPPGAGPPGPRTSPTYFLQLRC